MKKTILFLGLVALLGVFAAPQAKAYGYYHDDRYYYDSHHHRHGFVMYHHHHGYWDRNNGARVFINID